MIRRQNLIDPIAIEAQDAQADGTVNGVLWSDGDMTNWSQWSLSCLGIRCDVVSVLSSNHFPFNNPTSIQQLLYFYPIMPMLNSHTFQSESGVNTITRPSPRRSGGDYPSGQQVVVTNLSSF